MTTVLFEAASFAEPEYDVDEMVMSNGSPPYDRLLGMPVGRGLTDALK